MRNHISTIDIKCRADSELMLPFHTHDAHDGHVRFTIPILVGGGEDGYGCLVQQKCTSHITWLINSKMGSQNFASDHG